MRSKRPRTFTLSKISILTEPRLGNQLITRQPFSSPAAVVRHFGALQAQDYLGSLWALGLRTAKSSEARIEAALAEGSVLRTHIFRGTWQYVTPADVRWMLSLVAERVIASTASRHRELGLDAKTLRRSVELIAEALSGEKHLTRRELSAVLSRRRIDTRDARPSSSQKRSWSAQSSTVGSIGSPAK